MSQEILLTGSACYVYGVIFSLVNIFFMFHDQLVVRTRGNLAGLILMPILAATILMIAIVSLYFGPDLGVLTLGVMFVSLIIGFLNGWYCLNYATRSSRSGGT